ncbi:MAG: bifunctional rhamnulose-1-phosphate aldolase/short-chain dehydrogenase [Anaerolineae bacterium]|nr:bifunctional rhamnulose-1-phosphate aldolase/short-chain dehydrogenase [Anaerolineae bacterium]
MQLFKPDEFKYVSYLWDDAKADSLDAVDRLIYRSNLLGSDQRITNTGGGNTSSKILQPDPLTGQQVDIMWVKGSGGDLRTAKRGNFASLYMDKLMALQPIYDAAEVKGAKTPIEDQIVGMYPHTVYNLNPTASSIDTPLHAFIPARHVDHMHPNALIALAASADGPALMREIYGDEVAWVDWQRPGFDLGLQLQEVCRQNPNLKGIILGQHGLINWADDDKECYLLTLTLIEKAARYIEERDKGAQNFGGAKYSSLPEEKRTQTWIDILPKLRGLVSKQARMIGTVQSDEAILRFVNSNDAARLAELGTSCPDHFLRTKIKPLYVDWDAQAETTDALISKLASGIESYIEDYRVYYEQCKRPDSPALRNPVPTVILIPGLGMVAWGKNKSESRVTAEFYNCAVEVMRGAEAVSKYIALPRQEAFDIEYWLLEEAKLKRMPPEKTLARHVVIVIGAGNGIGKATALRVATDGAHIVCADLNPQAAEETAQELTEIYGVGIGVAGTGISGCGPAISETVNITDRNSVCQMYNDVVLAYGGVDDVIVTAGVFLSPDKDGHLPDDKWRLTFDVNVIGGYIVADEARAIWSDQGLRGAMVLTTSVNAVVSKKGSLAYDTSKAAANHLIRELAVELSPLIRVNGLAPATVVEGSTMFPRDRVISSLVKYNIAYRESDSTETLRDKLAGFYAQRTLTKLPITPEDQAEVAYLLCTDSFNKTTGQIFSVDGGLHEAFLR